MSFFVVHCNVMRCDGCEVALLLDFDHFPSEADGREASVNFDWRTDNEHDWCPECQDKPHDCGPDPEDPVVCARCGDFMPEAPDAG